MEEQTEEVVKHSIDQNINMKMDVFESGGYSMNIENADDESLLIALVWVRDAISEYFKKISIEKSLLKKHEKHYMTNTLYNKHGGTIEVLDTHIAETMRVILAKEKSPILSSTDNLVNDKQLDENDL